MTPTPTGGPFRCSYPHSRVTVPTAPRVIRGELGPVGPKPAAGRNHPCPCGSGKKFKRCHG